MAAGPPRPFETLCLAAVQGNLPLARELLQRDPGLAAAAPFCLPGGVPVKGLIAPVHFAVMGLCPSPAAGSCGRQAERPDPGKLEVLRLLLEAAPCSALNEDAYGLLPLHRAASAGVAPEALQLLLEAAPVAAAVRAPSFCSTNPLTGLRVGLVLPLTYAIELAARESGPDAAAADERVRLILHATPTDHALGAMWQAQERGLPLYAELVRSRPLDTHQWEELRCMRRYDAPPWDDTPCVFPGLAAALPAVLARSEAEAGRLLSLLPAEARERLHTAALCLARVERRLEATLPPPVVRRLICAVAEPRPDPPP